MAMKNRMRKVLLLTAAGTALLTGACTPTVAQRGNMLEDYQMKQVITGIHTRSDVLRLLGSPTTQAPFNDNVWYYIGQETEKHGILDPEVTKERIVAVVFDDEGIVSQVKELDPDRIAIPIERSKTPTHGHDITFMQQLLGNLGKFNTAGEKPAGPN
jgi:outer membrane protein assembly factor BamE (lipoprotein component of BamABCDE complex)